MRHAPGICASIAGPHSQDIDGRSPDDTPERGITFGCSRMLTTSTDAGDTPVSRMLNRCSTLAQPSMKKVNFAAPDDLGTVADQPKHAPDASEQCQTHMPDADATYEEYGRTDLRRIIHKHPGLLTAVSHTHIRRSLRFATDSALVLVADLSYPQAPEAS